VDGVDTTAVDNGYVSVTPLSLEMTHPTHMEAASFVSGARVSGGPAQEQEEEQP
jgi:broad specificity polyphosphatase/5'/3'-nucleotidase SurE